MTAQTTRRCILQTSNRFYINQRHANIHLVQARHPPRPLVPHTTTSIDRAITMTDNKQTGEFASFRSKAIATTARSSPGKAHERTKSHRAVLKRTRTISYDRQRASHKPDLARRRPRARKCPGTPPRQYAGPTSRRQSAKTLAR